MERLFRVSLVVVLLGASTAGADFLTQPVTFDAGKYDTSNMTTLFRADVSSIAGSTLYGLTIMDKGASGGSSGVFSGFDLDFVIFDRDGDLATTDDWILPLETQQTCVFRGTMRKGTASPYQPTAKHPGPLFGLLRDPNPATPECPIDFQTATLGVPDATFRLGRDLLSADTSHGWVSLGDGGSIKVAFPLISLAQGESLYLFLGDVGQRDEFPSGSAKVLLLVTEDPMLPPTDGAVRRILRPGSPLKLDGTPPTGYPSATEWLWDLDGDGVYDNGTGRFLDVTYEYLAETLGLPLGDRTIGLRTIGAQGATDYFYPVTLVPEPASWLLLALAGPLLRRRRRRS